MHDWLNNRECHEGSVPSKGCFHGSCSSETWECSPKKAPFFKKVLQATHGSKIHRSKALVNFVSLSAAIPRTSNSMWSSSFPTRSSATMTLQKYTPLSPHCSSPMRRSASEWRQRTHMISIKTEQMFKSILKKRVALVMMSSELFKDNEIMKLLAAAS